MPVAETDIFNNTTPGITYAQDNESWTVADNVFVGATAKVGILSSKVGSELINNGTIFSGYDNGVYFTGGNSTITNNAGASIAGAYSGLFLQKVVTIANHGEINGYYFTGVFFDGSAQFDVFNDGNINGNFAGIYSFSNNGGSIENAGLIAGNDSGIFIGPQAASTTRIDNSASGIIEGSESAIYTYGGGRLILDNKGTIAGEIDCDATLGNVNDKIVNKGTITGDVFLGQGNDNFKGAGGTSGKVYGEQGNDTLIGSADNDYLDGGAGMDTLRGDRGKDSLFGGIEADIFDFNSVKDSVTGANRDVIRDFERGVDKIDLGDIDAKTNKGGDQKFKFIGDDKFSKSAGELRFKNEILQGDVNGDGKADFEIKVKGVAALDAGDFVL
jgi:serralysin